MALDLGGHPHSPTISNGNSGEYISRLITLYLPFLSLSRISEISSALP